jgi:hypothetical protein
MKFEMTRRRFAGLFWLLLFAVYSVAAIGLTVLDAGDEAYADLSKVAPVTVHASEDMRNLGAAQMAAAYRAQSGAPFASLAPGTTLRVVWPDGSSEYVVVTNPAASDGIVPIPGTLRDAADQPVDGGRGEPPAAADGAGRLLPRD